MSKQEQNSQPFFITSTTINSYNYFRSDAEFFHAIAKNFELEKAQERNWYCRTALLLYIFSLEALIDWVLINFTSDEQRQAYESQERGLTLEQKWLVFTPSLFSDLDKVSLFSNALYPFQHFKELVQIRNDFVHPKHGRRTYAYNVFTSLRQQHRIKRWGDIPKQHRREISEQKGIMEKDLFYRQTHIPKDPYGIDIEHLEVARRIVDDCLKVLDTVFDGKLLVNDPIAQNTAVDKDYLEVVYTHGVTKEELFSSLTNKA